MNSLVGLTFVRQLLQKKLALFNEEGLVPAPVSCQRAGLVLPTVVLQLGRPCHMLCLPSQRLHTFQAALWLPAFASCPVKHRAAVR